MGDLIRFPSNNGAKPTTNLSGSAQASRLRKALGPQPGPVLSPTDQKTVAEALHKLLQEIEDKHHIKKAQVMREAGLGGEGDSTKHLSQYAIPPGANPARLRKKAGRYEKLAKVAAKLARLDESEVLLEVFGQASFWQMTGTREPEPEFEELANRLRLIMVAVARKHTLTAFFRDVKKGGGVATPNADCWRREVELGRQLAPHEIDVEFHFGHFGGPQIWPIEFDQPTCEAEDGNGDHMPVYPSLVLGAWRFDPFPVTVFSQINDAGESVLPISWVVEGRSTIELRLCIVPIGKNLEATPALRVECTVALSSPGTDASPSPIECGAATTDCPSSAGSPILTFPWQGMPPLKKGRSRTWGHNGVGDLVACEVVVETDPIPSQFGAYFREEHANPSEPASMAAGVRFLPIYGKVCEDWFGLETLEDQYDPMQQRLANRALGVAQWPGSEAPSTEFAFGTLADAVHRCLCDPINGIDKQFEHQAEFLKRVYDAHLRVAREERAGGWEQVNRRWERFGPSTND
jgi:hypothetical protein